jgi:parallel beta-helix repeat protein
VQKDIQFVSQPNCGCAICNRILGLFRAIKGILWYVPVPLAMVMIMSSASGQTTIHVPADVSTIQGAIRSASNGDTILVAPGTYRENIDFLGKAITVEGASAATTILQGGSAPGAVVRFTSGEGRNSVLSNFTIQGGVPAAVPDAGGILIYRASPTIENNIIKNNTGCGIGGYDSSPLIAGNLITGTTGLSEYEFYAVCRDPQGDNSPPPYGPNPAQSYPANGSGILLAGLPIDGQQAQINGNTIKNNSAYDCAGGIWLADAGAPLVENNIIANNYSYFDGAMAAWGNVAPVIVQNLIYGNVSDSTQIFNPIAVQNPAIYIVGYANAFGGITAVFAENTVVDNQALYQSYFVEWQSSSQVAVTDAPTPIPVYNNIIVGGGTLPAFACGGPSDTPNVAPELSHNDILVTGGDAVPVAGPCAGQMDSYGNISFDPLFASTNTSAANPFQLQLQSPAVDAGDNNAPDLPSEDILSHPRIQNAKGLPSAIIDMGVYEYPGVPAPLPPADFTLQIAPSSLNLGSSAQGQVTVTLTPNSSFTGNVALSCGSLPATLSCSFSSQSIYLINGVAQTVNLTIAANAPANSSSLSTTHGISAISSSSILLAAILFLPPLGTKKRARRLLALCALALLPLLLSSCSVLILTPHSHPTSYSVIITASSSSVQSTHSANVLVTVQ